MPGQHCIGEEDVEALMSGVAPGDRHAFPRPAPEEAALREQIEALVGGLKKQEAERDEKARKAAFFALERHVVEIDTDKENWPISRIVDVVLNAYKEALKA
jgi:hypothetical protein